MPERLEDRLRRYLSARQPSSPPDLERRSLERIFQEKRTGNRRFTLLAQLGAAALLVLLALGLAWTFRAARQPAGGGVHASAKPSASSVPTPSATPELTQGKPVPVGPRLSAIRMITSTVGWAQVPDRGGALIRTSDGGHSWVEVLPGVSTLSTYFALDENTAWAVESDGTTTYVSRTRDAGYHWQRSAALPLSAGANVLSMAFGDINNGSAVVFQNGSTSVVRTVDSGAHWTNIAFRPASGEASCPMGGITFLNGTTGWLSTSCGLYVSHDGGLTWQPESLSPASPSGGVQVFILPTFFDQRTGYLAVQLSSTSVGGEPASTVVYFTNDGGRTWTGRTTPTFGALPSFTFADPLHGWYVSKAQQILMRTTDGGQHWVAASHDPALVNLQSLQFTSPTVGFAQPLQQDHGILKSVDGGSTWQSVPVSVGTP
jgi:photosystem II stability/assembly factor-like uncharacterized protein